MLKLMTSTARLLSSRCFLKLFYYFLKVFPDLGSDSKVRGVTALQINVFNFGAPRKFAKMLKNVFKHEIGWAQCILITVYRHFSQKAEPHCIFSNWWINISSDICYLFLPLCLHGGMSGNLLHILGIINFRIISDHIFLPYLMFCIQWTSSRAKKSHKIIKGEWWKHLALSHAPADAACWLVASRKKT